MEFGFGKPAAAEHHAGALSDMGDVSKRIAVKEDKISAMADGD